MATWTKIASLASAALSPNEIPVRYLDINTVKAALGSRGAAARALKTLTRTLSRHGYGWDELHAFQKLRDELCELDIRYGQLYPQGIFLDLEEAGEIGGRILQPGQIEEAMERAPEEGRAQVRGDWIRRIADTDGGYRCSWTQIEGHGRSVDLGDPFVSSAILQPFRERRRERVPASVRERISNLGSVD